MSDLLPCKRPLLSGMRAHLSASLKYPRGQQNPCSMSHQHCYRVDLFASTTPDAKVPSRASANRRDTASLHALPYGVGLAQTPSCITSRVLG
eukprot:3449770-Prymnesium_polylepis.2